MFTDPVHSDARSPVPGPRSASGPTRAAGDLVPHLPPASGALQPDTGAAQLDLRVGCQACGAEATCADVRDARAFFRAHPYRCHDTPAG